MKLEIRLESTAESTLIELLHRHSDLSKSSLKKALNFGGVWLKSKGKVKQRSRKATKKITPGDRVSLYYDSRLYQQSAPEIAVIEESMHWGIWYKPAGVLSQGSPYGDRGCFEQQLSHKQRAKSRNFHLINRLDREVSGLMLVAYSKAAAKKLTEVWAKPTTHKRYQARVFGQPNQPEGIIVQPLDGKACATHYKVMASQEGASAVDIRISSGRFHQIRRHFTGIGHPILGDPRYGRNNHDPRGLQLVAYQLTFTCPIDGQTVSSRLPHNLCLF